MKKLWIGSWAAAGLVMAALASPLSAQTSTMTSDAWTWRASAYLWMPAVKTSTTFDLPGGNTISASTDTSFSDILSNLKFASSGTFEGVRGSWSFLGDVQYVNVGALNSKVTSISGPAGIISVPIDVGSRVNFKNVIGTFEGGYAVLQRPGARMEVLGGVRYTYAKTELDWQLSGPNGNVAAEGGIAKSKNLWDGVVGVRGTHDLGSNWDFRYYLDAGTGSTRFTWQAMAFLDYNFPWGDIDVGYRYLSYDLRNDHPISDLKMKGPEVMVAFKF